MSKSNAHNYQVTSAVLFIIFNRPGPTSQVFDSIRAARPAKLYIAADGPRTDRPNEEALCLQVREIATKIDWDCELKTLFQETNMGCKEAVSSAITWFFDNEEEGIVLEDDCLPANSFFKFCDELLYKYRHDTRVRHITGGNYQFGTQRGDATYYFSKTSHVWGWAGWRRVWQSYDKDLTKYSHERAKAALQNIFDDEFLVESWYQIFKDLKAGNIDTWDYQLTLTNYFNNALCIVPNVNLISNIGFGENATHTTSVNRYANMPVSEVGEITHPLYLVTDRKADMFTFNDQFQITERRRRYSKKSKRFKRWLRSIIGKNSI